VTEGKRLRRLSISKERTGETEGTEAMGGKVEEDERVSEVRESWEAGGNRRVPVLKSILTL
jgi:hypothetical protein